MNNRYPLQFTGKGSEYFSIWIVNIALTLLTLGIYSAWAKVRNKCWFYGHTLLDEQTFAYHATPLQILKGRLIALAFIIAYFFSAKFAPTLFLLIILALFLSTPWIVVNSLRFNARNSSYRGIRFGFIGTTGQAAKYFILYQFLVFITLGLALPYVVYKQTKFIVNHYRYGQTPVTFNADAKAFWKIYGAMLLSMAIPIGLIFFVSIQASILEKSSVPKDTVMLMLRNVLFIGIISFYIMIPIIGAYIKARMSNLVYNNSQIGSVSFVSTQRARDLIWIFVSNILLIALTFGIFIPWAKVRLAKYRTSHLIVENQETLEGFTNDIRDQISATGGELAEALDLDIGIN